VVGGLAGLPYLLQGAGLTVFISGVAMVLAARWAWPWP